MPYARHVYHVYAVRLDRRDAVRARLNEAGIGTNVHYPRPVHLQKCFAELGHRPGDFPVAEDIAARELSLPIYPELTDAQIEEVCRVLQGALHG
jgi:UDP-2-acetamido-2-deoxy-ribo-hexuluronate aminotransferase